MSAPVMDMATVDDGPAPDGAPMRVQVAFRYDIGHDLRAVVARVTGAPVHCCTLFGDECIDTAISGVRLLTRDQRLASGDWELVDVPPQYEGIHGRAVGVSRLGWKYDWFGAIAAWWLGWIAGAGWKTRVFCSEEVADELRAMGVSLLYARSAHYSPRALRDELVHVRQWPAQRFVRVA